MKKFIVLIFALVLAVSAFCGCIGDGDTTPPGGEPPEEIPAEIPEDVARLNTNLSADGFVRDNIGDFSVYEDTSAYRVVTTADELISALSAAKYHYTNVWDEETGTYTQEPASGYTSAEGTVHVIEIANDLNLGYNVISSSAKSSGLVSDFASKLNALSPYLYVSQTVEENGISQIKIENTSDLLIYSKNGAKLTHCGFKLTSDNNVVFRNLEFDEIWQWEDGTTEASKIGDYDWFGWAYFKIAFCGYIWIDHCTFGKSYDGQIDVSNPEYTANAGVAFRAPYGGDGTSAVHISWCNFNAGSDDEDGYIYKMMSAIEEEYQAHKNDAEYDSKHAYYDKLRDSGITFEQILYGIAVPQKKGFLCGDSGDVYEYNLKLNISFANCTFKNLEDRIPKLRGGNAYMYNCIVDSSQYYSYRSELRSKNAANLVKAVNSSWKCGLVSQGIVCGNGGSVKAENCVFKGIEYLLKNNDSNSADKVKGGYQLINCSYQKNATDTVYTGSSSDTDSKFTNDTPSTLKTENFSWHTQDGNQPFTPSVVPLADLEEFLANSDCGSGTRSVTTLNFLKSKYEAALYTLKQAYDKGYLSQDDLLSIAYYHHNKETYPFDGTAFNAELMGENYQPIEKSPEALSEELNAYIRQTLLNDLKKEVPDKDLTRDNIGICDYYGTYNGGVAVVMLYLFDGETAALNAAIQEDEVAGVTYFYSGYTGFFHMSEYDFSNQIMLWKAYA